MKLNAQRRDIVGKKVKSLRKEGNIPASIYGPRKESENLVVERGDFREAYKEVGQSKTFKMSFEDSSDEVDVLIKEVQVDPISQDVLHVSFYQVDQDKKITVVVPITICGESPAVKGNIGFLVNPKSEVTVRCLSVNIPEEIVVDISNLKEIGDNIKLDTIELSEDVVFDSSEDLNSSLVYIAPPQKEIEEEDEATAEVGVVGADEEGEESEVEEGEESGKKEVEGTEDREDTPDSK